MKLGKWCDRWSHAPVESGVVVDLLYCSSSFRLHLAVRFTALHVFELHNIGVLQLRIVAKSGLQVDVGITGGIVILRNWQIIIITQNTGEGKSMYIGLSFLFVTIRRIISNRIRYFYEKWTPITIQCHVYAHLFHVTVP